MTLVNAIMEAGKKIAPIIMNMMSSISVKPLSFVLLNNCLPRVSVHSDRLSPGRLTP